MSNESITEIKIDVKSLQGDMRTMMIRQAVTDTKVYFICGGMSFILPIVTTTIMRFMGF